MAGLQGSTVAPPIVQRFKRYFSIGVLNTALHWCVFLVAHHGLSLSQAHSNLIAFLIAVSFSFFMNARFTFQQRATPLRYALFVAFMAALSYATGHTADSLNLPAVVTLIVFSALSLVAGFVYANYVVFQKKSGK